MTISRLSSNTPDVQDGSIWKEDLNTTHPGHAVITRILPGNNVRVVSSGADIGTGEVTVHLDINDNTILTPTAYKHNNLPVALRHTLNLLSNAEIKFIPVDDNQNDQMTLTSMIGEIDFGKIKNIPSTVQDLGITNVYTKAEIDSTISLINPSFDALQGKPTTVVGYGITDAYTKTETDSRIQNVINVAPAALDTLNQLNAAIANDPSVGAAITTALTNKQDIIEIGTTGQYFRGDKTWQQLDKTSVGLSNVSNTSDSNKPVSVVQQAALNLKANVNNPVFTGTVSGINKIMVGLGNIDNVSDINKPVSTAQQAALDLKANQSTTYTKSEVDSAVSSAIVGITPSFANLTGKPSTVVGYGITDAYTKTEVNTAITNATPSFSTLTGKPTTVSGYGITNAYTKTEVDTAIINATPSFDTLTGKPTTVFGYGITDAYTKTETDDRIQAVVGAAPAALDTLVELADQLANDESAVTALTTTVSTKAPISNPTFTGTVSGITKAMVGLGSVDNTTDLNKPVSTATQTALNLKAHLASPTFTGTVSGITKAMVGLGNVENTAVSTWIGSTNITTVGNIGTGTWNGTVIADIKIATALTGKTYNGITPTASTTGFTLAGGTTSKTLTVVNTLTLAGTDNSTLNIGSGGTLGTGAFATIANYATLASPTFTGTVSGISKAMVGLGSVDNTTDLNKPVSTATQTALDLKANQATTYTKIEVDSAISSATPSFTTLTGKPTTLSGYGITDALTTSQVNSAIQAVVGAAPAALDTLVEIATQLANDESAATALTNTVSLKAPLASPTFTGTVSGISKAMVGLGSVDNTTDLNKPVSTATQTALNLKANQSTTYTKTEVDAAITNGTPSFTTLTGKPTTLSGYGITDSQKVNVWTTKSSAYTAIASDRIFADTSSSAWTLTLPASASIGDTITILDYSSTFGTNNLTVSRNGLNILGIADDLLLDVTNSATTLVYSGQSKGWIFG